MVNAANIIHGILGLLGSSPTSPSSPSPTGSTNSKSSSTSISTSSSIRTTSSILPTSSLKSLLGSTSTSKGSSSSGTSVISVSSSISSVSSSVSASVNVTGGNMVVASETVGAANVGASVVTPPVATKAVVVDGTTVNTNTSTATNSTIAVNATTNLLGTNVMSTVLVIARDNASAYSAYSGLNAYRIPYQVLAVPQGGATLPTLNSSLLQGNFGAIVILSEVSYDYGAAGFTSALTSAQLAQLYAYQIAFGVRMVRLDVYPSADSGTEANGGCCTTGAEQLVSISNSTGFPTAGLNKGAGLSTLGLYHYPATIVNPAIATEFAQFAPSSDGTWSQATTAGVINNIAGREQMVFFTSFATDWSATSNFLQHAWIHWATRGLYAGYRRIYLGTQVDDMLLSSSIYYPAGNTFRIRTGDLDAIKSWMATVNTRLNPGSNYFMEIGYNGNGNIEQATALDKTGKLCTGGPIEYDTQIDTPLEFVKPIGTGTSIWKPNSATYPYSVACTKGDPLLVWWTNTANRDVFAHVSHTFSHEGEDNATFSDINYEISWNQAWLKQTGLDQALHFSPKGLIPPAITGLHNGDALRAWATNGITNCVGDNTRPLLLNTQNEHWPLMSTVANDGYDGMQFTPRWATNIYYNCDSANCTVAEWIATSAGSGDIYTLLAIEKASSARHLLGLRHDPYMFHQANLRQTDVDSITINGVTSQLSLISMWVETVIQEMVRIINWPMISLKHDDISTAFANRMTADACVVQMSYITDPTSRTITGVTVTCNSNTCSVPLPVTFPASVTDTKGFTTEKIGNDPLTIWVKMTGQPVTFTLSSPVSW